MISMSRCIEILADGPSTLEELVSTIKVSGPKIEGELIAAESLGHVVRRPFLGLRLTAIKDKDIPTELWMLPEHATSWRVSQTRAHARNPAEGRKEAPCAS